MTKPATLHISLATFSGDITHAAMLGSEGGLARYRLRLTPWLWRLSQVRISRVWQDKTLVDIVDDVLSAYQPLAQWRWSEETDSFLADVPPAALRESPPDMHWVEKIGWCGYWAAYKCNGGYERCENVLAAWLLVPIATLRSFKNAEL